MTRPMLVAAAAGAVAGIATFVLFVAATAATFSADETVTPSASPVAGADTLAQHEGDAFAAWGTNGDGSPIRWDPCSPIDWVLDPSLAPPDARRTISLAMVRITAASGIEFAYRGTTTESPRLARRLVEEGTDQWAPVLITWVPGGTTDLPLGDSERGVTVPVAVRDGGPQVFVTGQVVFNSDKQLLPGFEDRHASWGAVILHELAHLVGLDHVDDPRELMHPTPGFGPVELGAGDLAGLKAIGAGGGCLDEPDPQELDVRYAN